MPINEVTAYTVDCDVCHRSLGVHPLTNPNTSWQIASFLTVDNARAAARAANWTLGRDLAACPNCSPITNPAETQTSPSAIAAPGEPPWEAPAS